MVNEGSEKVRRLVRLGRRSFALYQSIKGEMKKFSAAVIVTAALLLLRVITPIFTT
jgi:hypothetical protein